MRSLVRRLHKALYGHPDSGTYWEEHCNDAVESKGIYIRDVGKRFPGYVRVTIGVHMERVAEALIEAVKNIS